jgi:hypothetical protein
VKWRVEKMCDNCPFAKRGAGLHLRRSLARGRWREILLSLRMDGHFHCHKTTEFGDEGETLPGKGLLCAGSLAWQEKHLGYPGQLARIMERLL